MINQVINKVMKTDLAKNNVSSYSVIAFLINFAGKKNSAYLLGAILVSSLIDLLGIALIFPYLRLATNSDYRHALYEFFPRLNEFVGDQVLIGIGLLLIGLYLLKAIIQGWLLRFQYKKLAKLMSLLTDDAVNNLLKARYALFKQLPISEIGSTVSTSPIHASITFRALLQIANEGAFVGLLIITFLIASPAVTMLVMAVLMVIGLLLYFLVIENTALLGRSQEAAEKSRYRLLFTMLNTIRDIKVMGLSNLFESLSKAVTREFEEVYWRYNLNMSLPLLAIEAAVILAVVSTVMALIRINVDIAHALPLIGLIGVASARLVPAAAKFFIAVNTFRFYQESVKRFIDIRQNLIEANHEKIYDNLQFSKEISVVGLSLCYGGKKILEDIEINLKRGNSYGIVGPSGAGKSTLLDIITGLISADTGLFTCDGVAFNPFYSTGLSSLIGYVPQSINLLDESIAFNISFDNEYDIARMDRAIRMANLTTFIADLPGGLETAIGENGARLSGGQRQRIGLARALYREPAILILDEATSALDPITEMEITLELSQLKGEVTQLMVSHKISAVKDCDENFVIDKGRIVARGSHEELLATSSIYKELFMSQGNFS